MTVPISDELNIRERIEQLFQGASSGCDLDSAVASFEEAAADLSAAVSTFIPLDFELGAPAVQAWSPAEDFSDSDDQITLQLEREISETKFRCQLSYDLVEVFVSASFGAPNPGEEADFDCKTSQFCNFFMSNVALAIVRRLVGSINQSRTQNITFEKIIEQDPDGVPDVLKQSGFLATWPLIVNEKRHDITIYIPETEFKPKVAEQEVDADDETDDDVETAWSTRMQSSLALAEVQLRAVMNRPDMALEELSSLKVGDVVEFGDAKSATVLLECDGETLFTGEVGQKDGQFAVHVVSEVAAGTGL